MIKFLTQLLDLIYKKRCYFCGSAQSGTKMCDRCMQSIDYLSVKIFKNINGVNVYCATVYKDIIQKLIRGIKYHNQRELAFYQAKIMYDYWKKLACAKESYIVVPVPLYPLREKKRRYNHMRLVADEFVKLAGENYTVCSNLIKRIKNTKPQYKLSKIEREQNLKDAFEICRQSEEVKDKKILLIDDILTTGSTLKEMIKTLEKSGFNNLCAFVTSCSERNIK